MSRCTDTYIHGRATDHAGFHQGIYYISCVQVQRRGERRRKQSFTLDPLVLYQWKPIWSDFCAERKITHTNQHGYAAMLFPAASIIWSQESGIPATSFLTGSHLKHAAKKCKTDSSVLGITRLKSLKPALSSAPFLNRALNSGWTVSFYCWKGFPSLVSILFSFFLGKSTVGEQKSVCY